MLNSMTGFARETAESPLGALTCELRTVNHRYLDVQFRLPDDLRASEIDFRQRIAAEVRRGKIECSIHLKRESGDSGELTIDRDLVGLVGTRLEEIASALPNAAGVDPVAVLRWPGVVQEPTVDTVSLQVAAGELLGRTLASLQSMRASEGTRIAEMLDTRCADILAIAGDVRQRLPVVLDAVRAKQRERIDKLDIEADPARLETELALIAQKLDVDEELDRLDSHVSEIRDVIGRDEAVGRRLDFLMQELNREANTLGSKSADAETTRAAVDLKVLIEQMREQIQNVE